MIGIPEKKMSEDAPIVNPIIGIEKKCSRCGVVKPISDYQNYKASKDGKDKMCRVCHNSICLAYRKANPGKVKESKEKWEEAHPGESDNMKRKWYKAHKEERIETRMLSARQWRAANPDKMRDINKKSNVKRASTTAGRLNISMSARIRGALRGAKLGRHWEDLVGYNSAQLIQHIEKQFLPDMTWDNYGKHGWEIDHIIPVSAFNFECPEDVDFKKCWTLKNLQPLWWIDNLHKWNKLETPFQPSLSLGSKVYVMEKKGAT